MREHTVVRNNRSFTVAIFAEDNCTVYEQAVNPATGKGWQAKRNGENFYGPLAINKAMKAWSDRARKG